LPHKKFYEKKFVDKINPKIRYNKIKNQIILSKNFSDFFKDGICEKFILSSSAFFIKVSKTKNKQITNHKLLKNPTQFRKNKIITPLKNK
jgi:hypothetical protein